MGPFMSILQEHLGVMKKEELTSHQSQLTTFFLEALDFRAKHPEVSLQPLPQSRTHLLTVRQKLAVTCSTGHKHAELDARPLPNQTALLFSE